MKEDGGELLEEGGLEAEDVEENDLNGGRGPQRGLRRIGKKARRRKGRMRRSLLRCYIYHRQVEADRTGADTRGEQVEYRVVGGVSCVEVDGCFDFYCVD